MKTFLSLIFGILFLSGCGKSGLNIDFLKTAEEVTSTEEDDSSDSNDNLDNENEEILDPEISSIVGPNLAVVDNSQVAEYTFELLNVRTLVSLKNQLEITDVALTSVSGNATCEVTGVDNLNQFNFKVSIANCRGVGSVKINIVADAVISEFDRGNLQSEVSSELEVNDYCAFYSTANTYNELGAGTRVDPYQICNAEQIIHLSQNSAAWDKSFLVLDQIDLSSFGQNSFNPIGDNITNFTGYFDGGHFAISGFDFEDGTSDYVGFFGRIGGGGVVVNLNLVDLNIVGKNYVGGITGYNDGAIINSRVVNGRIEGLVNYVGGITGYNGESILNSYSSATLIGAGDSTGGVAGYNGRNISNSYVTGSVTGTTQTGGLVGYNDGAGKVWNSYSSADVSGTQYTGGAIGFNEAEIINSYAVGNVNGNNNQYVSRFMGFDMATSTNNYVYAGSTFIGCSANCNSDATTSHPNLSDFYNVTNQPMSQWDYIGESVAGKINDHWLAVTGEHSKNWFDDPNSDDYSIPFDGSGIGEDPYLITDVSEYLLIASNPRWMGSHFKLINSLDFTAQQYLPIGDFQMGDFFYGVFDGNSKSLSNITYHSAGNEYIAPFSFVFGNLSTIFDLNILNISVLGQSNIAGLVAYLKYGVLENIQTSGLVDSSSGPSGGLVGSASGGRISNSSSSVSIDGHSSDGGLVGSISAGIIEDSSATGTVTATGIFTGGLVGLMNSDAIVSNSFATGNIQGGTTYTGGLVGYNNASTINENSYATGIVTGDEYVGGLVGYNNSTGEIIDSYATGAVNGGPSYTGGLAGGNYGDISYSYATGNVVGDESTGGLVGRNQNKTITSSYATGSVTGGGFYVGGLVGYGFSTTISLSFATGNVTGTGASVGGLIGKNEGTGGISKSFATGSVYSTGDGVGGLVGNNDLVGVVTNCYAKGNVSGTSTRIGGFVGYNVKGTISNSYAKGTVTGGNSRTGGFAGESPAAGIITNSFALGNVAGNNKTFISRFIGNNAGTTTGNYVYSAATFSGCSGSCNLDARSTHATLAAFYDSSNAPMSSWTFGTIWVEVDDNNDTVLDDYPDLIGLP